MRLTLLLMLLPGCYLSHERPGAPGTADAGVDAPRGDAPIVDAPRPDAPVATCERLTVTHTLTLDHPDALGSVTPRIIGLDGGATGLVYVHSDGDPVRVIYERIGASLESVTGPVTVSRRSWTWAEITRANRDLYVAFGEVSDARSVLVPITERGEASPPIASPAPHPSLLVPGRGTMRWVSFDDEAWAIVVSNVSLDGSPTWAPIRIPTGPYGSGFAMTPLPGGISGAWLGYPRDGAGGRRGFLRIVGEDGTLGPERQLGDTEVRSVRLIDMGPELIVVSNGEQLRLERVDLTTLDTIDVVTLPAVGATYVTGSVGDHVVIADLSSAEMRALVLSRELRIEHELREPLPASTGPGVSVASVEDAMVVVSQRTNGPESFPFLMRIACD